MFVINVLEKFICGIIFIFLKSDYQKVSYKNLNKFLDTELTIICEQANLSKKHVFPYIVKPMCNHIDIIRNERFLYHRSSHDALYAFNNYDFYLCYADMLSSYSRYWRARGFYINFHSRSELLSALLKRGHEKNYFSEETIDKYESLSRKVSIWKIPDYTSDELKFISLVLFVVIPLFKIIFIFID